MSRTTAYELLNVHEKFGGSVRLADTLPRKVLYLLAAPSTSDEVIEAFAERSAERERLSLDEVKQMIAKAARKYPDMKLLQN
jgi:hypothetical protein